jgi:hypothetical protein
MIEIEIKLGSKHVSPWMEEMICLSVVPVLIVAKSVLTNRGIVNGNIAWSTDGQLQLDDGGENK